jgi:hypothetical protein
MSLEASFKKAIEKEHSTKLKRIECHTYGSEPYTSLQYNFYGDFFLVDPMIDVVEESEEWYIRHIHFTNDTDEPYIGMFLARYV